MTERAESDSRNGQSVANVERRLRDEILVGAIPAGSVTSQAALSARLGVGRTPLREALRLLEAEGLILNAPNRRVQVAALSGADAEELYVMRISLETVAITLTVPELTSTDFAELDGYMAQMEYFMRTHDGPGLREPHRAFHLRLVSAGGQRGVAEMASLFDHAERYRLAFGVGGDWELRSTEHRAILDAAAAGDGRLAAERLAGHYAHTARLIFAGLDEPYEPVRLNTALDLVSRGSVPAGD
jgi:DNA-binding GntR family transcriptional regulator